MAFEQLVSKISGLFSAKPSGNAELTEQHLLALTKKCLERAQRLMTSPTASAKKFNFEQCMYLVDKLKMAVESADLLIERRYLSFPSQVDSGNCLEVFKLLYALATEVEYFTQICSKDAWIQAALTLFNVSEHISSIGFDLMLCSVHSSEIKQLRERRILTSTEVDGIFEAEVEVVEAKASVDRDTMSRELHDVLSKLRSSSSEYQLAVLLLRRLDKSWKVPGGDSAESSQASLSESISRSLERMESLGKGCAGTVYRAKWLGAEVAQKTFYGPNFPDFEKEVAILAGLSHPNVASLLYCDKDKRECSIVMELMDTDLFGLIQRRLRSNKTQLFPFGLLEAVDIMHQVGKGMRYLHEMKIVHRDLKSMNILVKCRRGTSELESAYVVAKVADFGMSKTKEKRMTYSNQTLNVGTSRWMAPETFKVVDSASQTEMSDGEAMVMKYPFKSDVYSFGMVCYEILTGDTPFSTTYSLSDVKEMVLDGVRPPLPYECPSLLKGLIERCWSADPSKRPRFDEICKELRYMKYLYPKSVIEVVAKLVKMYNASPAACQPQAGIRILNCVMELRGEIDAFDIENTGVLVALMGLLEVENQDCQQDAVLALYILSRHISIQTGEFPCGTILNFLRSTRPNVREAAVGLLDLMVAKKAVYAKMFMETPEALKCTLVMLKKSNLFPEGHEGLEIETGESSASALLKRATEDGDDSVRLGILNDGLDDLLQYVQKSGNDEFKELLATMLSLICTTGNGPILEAVTEGGGHIFLLTSLRANISKEAAARGLLCLIRGNAKSRAHVLKADFVTIAVDGVEEKFASTNIALALAEIFSTSEEMDQIYASRKGVHALLVLLEHCREVEGKGAAAAVIAKLYPRLSRGGYVSYLQIELATACPHLLKYLEQEDKSQLKMFLSALAAFATERRGRQVIHGERGEIPLIKYLKNKELKVEEQGLMLKILTKLSSSFAEEGERRDSTYHKIYYAFFLQNISQLLLILPESEEFKQHKENMKNLLILVRNFSMTGKAAVTQLVVHNAVDVLLKVLKEHVRVGRFSFLSELAVMALEKFMDEPSGKQAFIRGNGIQSLVAVLRHPRRSGVDVKRVTTIILTSVATDPDTRRVACDAIFSCYMYVFSFLNHIMYGGISDWLCSQAAVLMMCLVIYGPTSEVCSAMRSRGSLDALEYLKKVPYCKEIAEEVLKFVMANSEECKSDILLRRQRNIVNKGKHLDSIVSLY